ncbi:MAG: DUF1127 domain-containing protein [Pseudomonadota bacterium]
MFAAQKVAHRAHTRRPLGLGQILMRWIALAHQRQSLSKLDDRMLKDIGVTRAEADREAKRPAWDAPIGWQDRL